MTRLILFFKNIHAQNIYKLSSVSIHFSSDIHDVETSFFTQKINTDIWPILVTLCFRGKQKIQSQVSIGFLGIYYTVFTVFKGQKMVQTCTFLRSKKKPFKCSRGTKLECSIIRSRSTLGTMRTGFTIHGFIITGR